MKPKEIRFRLAVELQLAGGVNKQLFAARKFGFDINQTVSTSQSVTVQKTYFFFSQNKIFLKNLLFKKKNVIFQDLN